jgi:serine protease Do
VKIEIVRNGAPQSVTVKVGARRTPAITMVVPPAPNPPMPPNERWELRMPDMPRSFMSWRSTALGVECETLEGQLAQYFGVKEGVLVRSVMKGSAAEKAGIKAGDVIIRVDDAHVATPAEVSSHFRASRGKPVAMVVMRDHKELTLSVTVDGEDHGGN